MIPYFPPKIEIFLFQPCSRFQIGRFSGNCLAILTPPFYFPWFSSCFSPWFSMLFSWFSMKNTPRLLRRSRENSPPWPAKSPGRPLFSAEKWESGWFFGDMILSLWSYIWFYRHFLFSIWVGLTWFNNFFDSDLRINKGRNQENGGKPMTFQQGI